MWPNGILADKTPPRDESIRHITQVLCKAKLLGIVSGKTIQTYFRLNSFERID